MTFRLLLLLIISPFYSSAAPIEISGKAETLAGYEIRLLMEPDPFSGLKEIIAIDTVDVDGKFHLSASLAKTRLVFLAVNRFEAPLFVEPNRSYDVLIPDQPEFDLIQTWRPFEYTYLLQNVDSTDLNRRIAEFDEDYYSFYDENARLIGTAAMRKKVGAFAAAQTTSDGYLGSYIGYTLAEMKLSNGFPKKGLYEGYLASDTLHFTNPAFTAFFDKFYADYFNRYDIQFRGKSMPQRLREGMKLGSLDSLLLRDDFLARRDIREWVIIKSIAENLYSNDYPKKPMLDLLKELAEKTQDTLVRTASKNILERYDDVTSPVVLESLPLVLTTEKTKKPGILAIGHLDSREFTREQSLLDDLVEEYGDYFSVVKVFIKSSPDRPIPEELGQSSNDYELMHELDIRSLPWYGWINEEGLIVERAMIKPSEGLESRLYSIRAKAREKEKIKVGQ